jgi:hypothetical protein
LDAWFETRRSEARAMERQEIVQRSAFYVQRS